MSEPLIAQLLGRPGVPASYEYEQTWVPWLSRDRQGTQVFNGDEVAMSCGAPKASPGILPLCDCPWVPLRDAAPASRRGTQGLGQL